MKIVRSCFYGSAIFGTGIAVRFTLTELFLMLLIVLSVGIYFNLFNHPESLWWAQFKDMLFDAYYHLSPWYRRKKVASTEQETIKRLEDKRMHRVKEFSKNGIALVSFEKTPFRKTVLTSCIQTITNTVGNKYQITAYNAGGSKKNMASIMQEIKESRYEVIIPIGAVATVALYFAQQHFIRKIPSVFAGVKDPKGLGIISSLQCSGNVFTGVTREAHNYEQQAEFLKIVKPSAHHVLIPYNLCAPWLQEDKDTLVGLLKKFGIRSTTVAYSTEAEMRKGVYPLIINKRIDTVLTLRGLFSEAMVLELSGLCDQMGVTFYSSDVGMLEFGAGLAYGAPDELFGIHAGQMALHILEDGIAPAALPIKVIKQEEKIWLHAQRIMNQGIDDVPHLISMLDKIEIYHGNK